MDVLLELLLVSEQYLYKYLIGRDLEARGDRTPVSMTFIRGCP